MKTESRRDGTVQLADWWEDLLWPKVLSAAALGLRPARIGLALFGMVLGFALLALGSQFDKWIGSQGVALPGELATAGGCGTLLWHWFVHVPHVCLTRSPATAIIFVVAILPMWLVVIGAISRMTAVEFSKGDFLTWTEALSFSLARMRSLVGAVLGPLVVIWAIALTLAVGGWLLLHWPWVNLVGGILYGLAIVLGIAASLIAIAYLLGHCLLVPAVACEGSDAIDAVQRAYAYTLDRPVRLIVYSAISTLGLAFVMTVVIAVVGGGIGIAYLGTGAWAGEKGQQAILHGTNAALPFATFFDAKPEASFARVSWLIRLWTMIPVYAVFACFVSCGMACTTVVYLCLRRVCDGQDTAELWVPGMIEGVMEESLKGRAQVGAAMGKPAAGAGSIPEDEAADEP